SGSGGTDENYNFALNGHAVAGTRYNVNGGYLALWNNPFGNDLNNEFFVIKGRALGLGTINPAFPLDVNGNANISGTLTAGSISAPNLVSTNGSNNFTAAQTISVNYPVTNASGATQPLLIQGDMGSGS